ncbi:hypothetical protein GMST_07880 [Geomonas silvestris]|uniref:Heme exporter protein D n=1 Tax=Geomonas silvestris TaxID=2740184 RepID=A0A6V8MF81_9BACT|nr:hypothetical protein [Geomonas silvestris]GFO58463.1 hypothetical protein GMST_07880 [Geomonas silvestris]
MATGWSNYQVTQGYLEWFYYVKFAAVSAIAVGFACFSLSRVRTALKGSARRTAPGKARPATDSSPPTGSNRHPSSS